MDRKHKGSSVGGIGIGLLIGFLDLFQVAIPVWLFWPSIIFAGSLILYGFWPWGIDALQSIKRAKWRWPIYFESTLGTNQTHVITPKDAPHDKTHLVSAPVLKLNPILRGEEIWLEVQNEGKAGKFFAKGKISKRFPDDGYSDVPPYRLTWISTRSSYSINIRSQDSETLKIAGFVKGSGLTLSRAPAEPSLYLFGEDVSTHTPTILEKIVGTQFLLPHCLFKVTIFDETLDVPLKQGYRIAFQNKEEIAIIPQAES